MMPCTACSTCAPRVLVLPRSLRATRVLAVLHMQRGVRSTGAHETQHLLSRVPGLCGGEDGDGTTQRLAIKVIKEENS